MTVEELTEFQYRLVVSKDSPLAEKYTVDPTELSEYIEITHADSSIPSLPFSDTKKNEHNRQNDHRIYVFERASQFDLLSENPQTFMWVSPVPEKLLKGYGLVEIKCNEAQTLYKDVRIYKKEYRLSPLDKMFIAEVNKTKPN